jgi:hypothetical protein
MKPRFVPSFESRLSDLLAQPGEIVTVHPWYALSERRRSSV